MKLFVSRRRYEDLSAKLQDAIEERDEARVERDNSRNALRHLAKQYGHLLDTGEPMPMFTGPSRAQQFENRLARALKACARYRKQLAAEHRHSAFLARQLNDATGVSRIPAPRQHP